MNHIKAILFIIFFTISFLFFSCEKGTEPEELKPGRRDYTWTEDTLNIKSPNTLTYRYFVGSSPNNLWLGTLDASFDVSLWHYNGEKWQSIYFPGYAASALWLFDDNTLWVGTKGSIIWKRENDEWVESYKLKLDGYEDIYIFDFHGETKNNIFAVGWAVRWGIYPDKGAYKAIILHFDGSSWNFVDIPDMRVGLHYIFFEKNIGKYVIHGLNADEGFLDKVYIFDGKKIEEIISIYKDVALSEINGTVYIDSDKKVYKYLNSGLTLWKDFSRTKFLAGFAGRNENDFISNSYEGVIHYNGIDIEVIYKTDLELQAKVIFAYDIFIASEDKNRNYIIIHGKLKE